MPRLVQKRLVAAEERDRDVAEARMHITVAKEAEAMNDERGEGSE
jgi:hypothetical protein